MRRLVGCWFIPDGNSGLGTSGSGDALTAQAACWATYLHAVAGDRLSARIGRLGFWPANYSRSCRRSAPSWRSHDAIRSHPGVCIPGR
jgi:NAD(P)H-hydrate repair Nnr-like enzyme with NAD(P)H-hydrate dehydratase domain